MQLFVKTDDNSDNGKQSIKRIITMTHSVVEKKKGEKKRRKRKRKKETDATYQASPVEVTPLSHSTENAGFKSIPFTACIDQSTSHSVSNARWTWADSKHFQLILHWTTNINRFLKNKQFVNLKRHDDKLHDKEIKKNNNNNKTYTSFDKFGLSKMTGSEWYFW